MFNHSHIRHFSSVFVSLRDFELITQNSSENITSRQSRYIYVNAPAKAFTPPAKTKMGTKPGRAVTREFRGGGGGVCSLISVLPNEFLFKSVIIRIPSKAF